MVESVHWKQMLAHPRDLNLLKPLTIAIGMHAEESNQSNVNDEQGPRQKTAPDEDEMNYLCHLLTRYDAMCHETNQLTKRALNSILDCQA